MTNEEYRNFITNPENHCNCDECPHNNGFDSFQDRLPCGQWHCWVDLHCERNEEEN